jgi:hypothetical protein
MRSISRFGNSKTPFSPFGMRSRFSIGPVPPNDPRPPRSSPPIDAIIPFPDPPPDSVSHGYEDCVVQELVVEARVTCYRRERIRTPDGQTELALLPHEVLPGRHFGPNLICYLLYQHRHHGGVSGAAGRGIHGRPGNAVRRLGEPDDGLSDQQQRADGNADAPSGPAAGAGASGGAVAQYRHGIDHSGLREDAEDQRQHAERGGPPLPGYVREFEENLSEDGTEFLELPAGSHRWNGNDPPLERVDPPTRGGATWRVGRRRTDLTEERPAPPRDPPRSISTPRSRRARKQTARIPKVIEKLRCMYSCRHQYLVFCRPLALISRMTARGSFFPLIIDNFAYSSIGSSHENRT